ncbi:MAG TPA: aminotransferase class I/II-fold pyridoxal phosphate-dependent enzyme [Terriglobales bacterium]|nr:aminotransferase class I/II-fold pyridoxal phosphate-dependent enzyme [Terriglobales bacterium]
MKTDSALQNPPQQTALSGDSADATRCIHAGEERHGQATPITTSIAQTSVFILPNVEELRRLNAGQSSAYMYTRYANPTTRAAEEKIAALEGAQDCIVTSSGMSASLAILLALCKSGDEIVAMQDLYGGTVKLFEKIFARFSVTTRFVPFADIDKIERYFTPKTAVLFLESPTNPTLRCVDLADLAALGHRHGAKVIVDNTFATPILQKPLQLGADVSYHSATKFLGGHSDVTAGAVCGSKDFIRQAREMMILSGGSLDPGASYLLIRGLKTLQIRIERACQNARRIAAALAKSPRIERVMYPGLPGNPGHEFAKRQMSDFGMVLSINLRGGGAAAERFIDRLKLWYLATSLGGVESSVSYPVLSSHAGMTEEQWRLMDVSPSTVRLSVGIESFDDLFADLEQALAEC